MRASEVIILKWPSDSKVSLPFKNPCELRCRVSSASDLASDKWVIFYRDCIATP